MPQVSETRRNASWDPWVVALWLRFACRNVRRAERSDRWHVSRRDRASVEIGAWRSFHKNHMARLTALPRLIRAAIPIKAGTDERGEEPNPVCLWCAAVLGREGA